MAGVYVRRYAQAVFGMALEQQELNAWQSDLRKIASMVRDEALFALLANREVSFDEKTKVLSERLGEIHPMALKLVSMLVARGRLGMIEDISDEYQQLLDNYRGVEGAEIAEVTTAIPLDDEERLKLAQRITDMVGKPVVLKTEVDPSVIGGVIIRIGDKLIDGSIRSKLTALRRELGGVGK
ncbi:MAG: ATP synthase F1 subunit delta [Dehalococcoidales bacterium]|nr:MAG: ATP synthase F1 subunit delta [Dehalococcoidales bacterium]